MSNMITHFVGCYMLVLLTAVSALLAHQVLVKSLFDRGFLFLLSSAQMVESKGTEKLFFFSLPY